MISEKYQPEHLLCMQAEWADSVARLGELSVRDTIVESICPEIHGMYVVKLALALVICSGGIENTIKTTSGCNIRGQSHLLLVGDPGLAKSKLLMSAASFAPRAVHTTGMGSSAAGLTAAAIQENGEWQLEAGALVLADGGICCIDEFNLMRETDRASIHEAMEQQTVSLAKAGMVCKLSTRCAVVAATNPRNLYSMCEPEGASSLNVGIASPLMSRFDLVYILRDERIPEWDDQIATHLLELAKGVQVRRLTETPLWNTEKLQSHFAAVRSIHPRMTDEANQLISAYYRRCRADPRRDNARSTVRLLDSLIRLAQAHARLLFRNEVNVYDAVIVIRLMESTQGFGRVLQPYDVIKEELPLGPSQEIVAEVYTALGLGIYEPQERPAVREEDGTGRNSQQERPATGNSLSQNNPRNSNEQNNPQNESVNASQHTPQNAFQRLSQNASQRVSQNASQNVLTNTTQNAPPRESQNASQSRRENASQAASQVPLPEAPSFSVMYDENLSEDELDRILTLDIPPPTFSFEPSQIAGSQQVRTTATTSNDVAADESLEDELLSQALDNAIQNQLSQQPPIVPVPRVSQPFRQPPKFKFLRSRMSLNKNLGTASTSANKENTVCPAQIPARIPSEDIFSESLPESDPRNERANPVKIKRNRLLESDDSDEEEVVPGKKPTRILTPPFAPKASTSKVSPKTMNKLNAFVNPKLLPITTECSTPTEIPSEVPVAVQTNQTWPQKERKSKKDEDSGFGTQEIQKTQARSSQRFEYMSMYDIDSDEDLSCLDNFDLPQR